MNVGSDTRWKVIHKNTYRIHMDGRPPRTQHEGSFKPARTSDGFLFPSKISAISLLAKSKYDAPVSKGFGNSMAACRRPNVEPIDASAVASYAVYATELIRQ